MRKIRKQAYLACFAIIVGLGALAHYSNQEVKKFEINFNDVPPIYKPAPEPELEATLTPGPNTITIEPLVAQGEERTPTSPIVKSKNIILELGQYKASLSEIKVNSGYKINLITKNNKTPGTLGLNLHLPDQEPVLVRSAETKEISFMATSDFTLDISEEKAPNTILYSIKVDVK